MVADPWAVVSQTPAPKSNPWSVVSQKPAPKAAPSPYEATSVIDTDLSRRGLKATGDYRTPARERQLAAQGAGTARGLSNHSRGTPDAPGAHDFVPTKGDWNTALTDARGEPGVKDAFIEGAQGGQGRHIHVDMAANDPWSVVSEAPAAPAAAAQTPKKDPWAVVAQTPAPKTQPPANEPQLRNPGNPIARAGREFMGAARQSLEGAPQRMAKAAPEFGGLGSAIQGGNEELNALTAGISKLVEPLFHERPDAASDIARAQTNKAHANPLDPHHVATPEEKASVATQIALGLIPVERVAELGSAGARAVKAAKEALAEHAAGREARTITEAKGVVPTQDGAAAVRAAPKKLPKPPTASGRTPTRAPTRAPSLAAARETPELAQAHVVGEEANPATRTANALYRLNGSNTADKIEMQQFRRDLAPEIKDPATKEALYHALEEPLAGGKGEIPANLQAAHEAIQPYLAEQTEGINKLRELNDPTVDEYLENTGYVHRIKEGSPNLLEPEGGAPRSPFQTRKSLTTKPDSARARKFIVLEDERGNRIFPKGQDEPGDKTYAELKPGMTYRPPGGAEGAPSREFKVVQPTTKEIEANTDVRYQKDAIDNTLSNVLQIRRALRNKEVLDLTLADMKERGVAHRSEWYYRDEGGKLQVARANEQAPQGFESLHDNPHTRGWQFDPNDAQVQELKDWLPKREEGWVRAMDRFNNFMLRSDFLSPFVHPKNIAEFWGTSRGFDWLSPQGYGRMAKTLPKAVSEVMTMGPAYKQYLREGSALLSGDARTNSFNEMLVHKAGKEMIEDPKSFAALKSAFGDAISTPARLYTQFQEASHKMMWSLGDIMMMQRVMELQEKGMSIRDAIAKAEEVIPNYRVPAQIMDSPNGGRMLHHLFANNRFIAVGRYHYNRLAAWGRMFKKVAKGSPEERKEVLGQFLAMATIGAFVLPALDKAIQMASGNKNARVKRGGITSLPDAVGGVASGREELPSAIAQVIDVAPLPELAYEEKSQKDYFGQDVYSKFSSPAQNTAREIELPAGQFGPFNMGMQAATGGYGPERVAGNLFGVDMPQKARGQVKSSTAKSLRGQERRRERKDPLAMGLESIGRSQQ